MCGVKIPNIQNTCTLFRSVVVGRIIPTANISDPSPRKYTTGQYSLTVHRVIYADSVKHLGIVARYDPFQVNFLLI